MGFCYHTVSNAVGEHFYSEPVMSAFSKMALSSSSSGVLCVCCGLHNLKMFRNKLGKKQSGSTKTGVLKHPSLLHVLMIRYKPLKNADFQCMYTPCLIRSQEAS